MPEVELIQRALNRQRADDQEEVIRQRQRVYQQQTQPLIDHYEGQGLLSAIDGHQTIEQVAQNVIAALEVAS